MQFSTRQFFVGFGSAIALLGFVFGGLQLLLTRVGELCVGCVVAEQVSDRKALYSSGVNQYFFGYKLRLMEAERPQVIAIGSSRAMQVRGRFFKSSFVNLGGGVSNVPELEALAASLRSDSVKAKYAIVFVDPWWFNGAYAESPSGIPNLQSPPEVVSLPLVKAAMLAMTNGNWLSESRHSSNLGIHSILTGEGFAKDGSYHYTSVLSGSDHNFGDVRFADTFDRIQHGNRRFQRGDHVDAPLLRRACTALRSINETVGAMVVIAPPFAVPVWSKMQSGGYGYIAEAHAGLAQCLGDVQFHDFSSGDRVPGGSDCEFVDGLHGGDVTYARMLVAVARDDLRLAGHVDQEFMQDFIAANAGHAGGLTTALFTKGTEPDFLDIGCRK